MECRHRHRWRWWRRSLASALFLSGLSGLADFAPPARAATYTVTNTNDAGTGSLRDAIDQANANAGSHTIVFDPGVTGTIHLGAALEISNPNIVLDGPAAGELEIVGTVTGSGRFAKSGAGTMVLSSDNHYTGGTSILGGSLVVGSDARLGNGGELHLEGGTLEASQPLTLSRSISLTNGPNSVDTNGNAVGLSGNITGTGSLDVFGGDFVTLSGTNSFSGGTFIHDTGTRVASNSAFGTGMVFLLGQTELAATGAPRTLDNQFIVGSFGGEIATLSGDHALTFTNALDGIGELKVLSGATHVLSTANSYLAGTDLVSGRLRIGDNASLGSGAVWVSGDSGLETTVSGLSVANEINLNGSLDLANATNLTLNGDLVLGTSNPTILVGPGGTTLTGSITHGGAPTAFTIGGTGAGGLFTIQSANTYSAPTTITNDAVVGIGSSTALGTGAVTLQDGGLRAAVNGLSLGNAITLGSDGGRIDGANNLTLSGAISGSGGLTKSGGGILTLSGSNTYTGGTAIDEGSLLGDTTSLQGHIFNQGELVFSQAVDGTYAGNLSGTGVVKKLGAGIVTFSGTNSYTGGTTILGGGLLGTTNSLQGDITNNGVVTFDQSSTGTYAGVMDGTGALVKAGTGTLILSGANTFSGGTTISGGILEIDASKLTGDILNNGQLTFTQGSSGTFSGDITGTGSLTKSGIGSLTLGGANNYSGGTTVSQGTLVGDTGSLQGDIANSGTVTFIQTTDGTYAGDLSGTGQLAKFGTGTLTLSGANTHTGGTTVFAGSLRGDTDSLTGNIVDNGNVAFQQDHDASFTGNITGTGSLTKSGTGILTLSGANTYAGGTLVESGTLRGAVGSIRGNLENHGHVTFETPDQFGSELFSGAITGNGSITKEGPGTLELTGLNSYLGGTTVIDGQLRVNTSSLPGNVTLVDNGGLVFDQDTNATYGGIVSGHGFLMKTGTGTLTLTGGNSPSGGVSIVEGTLIGNAATLSSQVFTISTATTVFQQDADATSGAWLFGLGTVEKRGAGTLTLTHTSNKNSTGTLLVSQGILKGNAETLFPKLVNNATLQFDQVSNGDHGGPISGTGRVVKTGAGTLTLLGNNTYTGGTVIEAGKLISRVASLPGDVTNNSTLELIENSNVIYSGEISGTGSLTKSGVGTLGLSGANTYSGGTTVNGGTLVVDTTSLPGDVVLNGSSTLGFSQYVNATYSGTISGDGHVTKGGTGTLVLAGDQDFSGLLRASNGTLIVNGDLANAIGIAVDAGGTLGGVGSTAILTNRGRLTPGNSIGTFQVTGPFTSHTTSQLDIEVNAAGQTDKLDVGSANLQGGTVNLLAAPGSYTPGMSFEFLEASGGVSGTFSTVTDNLPSLNARLVYSSTGVRAELVNPFALASGTTNQRQVGGTLDGVSGNPGSTTALTQVGNQVAQDGNGALDALAAEITGTNTSTGIQNANTNTQAVAGQIRPNGGAATGGAGTGGGIVMNDTGGTVVRAQDGATFTGTGWIVAAGMAGMAQGDGNSHGLSYGSGYSLFGVDRYLDDETRCGLFGGAGLTNVNTVGLTQGADVESYLGGLYLRHHLGEDYYVLTGSFGCDHYDTQRVVLDDVVAVAAGQHNGWQSNAYLERGWILDFDLWQLRPYGAASYTYLRQHGYTETGAGALNLTVDGVDAHSLRTIMGTEATRYLAEVGNGNLGIDLRALWLHELLDTSRVTSQRFGSLGSGTFTTFGNGFGRDWAVLGVGPTWNPSDALTLYANYDVQFNERQVFHTASGGLVFVF